MLRVETGAETIPVLEEHFETRCFEDSLTRQDCFFCFLSFTLVPRHRAKYSSTTMDVDFEYMKAAVEYAAKHGYKATFREFPKCKHPSTLERYKQRVLSGSNELSVVEVRARMKKRISDEAASGVKVDLAMAKEYFKDLENRYKLPERLKGTNGFLGRCLREARRDGGESGSEDDDVLDKLNDFLEEEDDDPGSQSNNGQHTSATLLDLDPSDSEPPINNLPAQTDLSSEQDFSNCATVDFSHLDVQVSEDQPDSTSNADQGNTSQTPVTR